MGEGKAQGSEGDTRETTESKAVSRLGPGHWGWEGCILAGCRDCDQTTEPGASGDGWE